MNMNKTLKVAAIHDLSGFGRCSLTVILPTLSTMGVQVVPVPTAVLSSHTGGLGEVCVRDLTDYISPALEHYKKLQIDFDCVYSGFLNSQEQVDHCLEFFNAYPNAFKVVDPVMGDHGKAYKSCDEKLRSRMKELVGAADLITPNLTEAYFLLNQDYEQLPLTSSQAKSMLLKLSEMGPKYVVVTGVLMAGGYVANIGYDRENNRFWQVKCNYVPVSYPGTGDLSAAVIVGGMLTGDSLPIAIARATDFAEFAIKTTFSYNSDPRYGVMLENCLHWLVTTQSFKDHELL